MVFGRHLAGATALALCFALPVCAQTSNGIGSPFELAFWQSVTGSDDPTMYEAYLLQYPAGTFSALAKAKVVNLRKAAGPVPAPAPAAVAVPAAMGPTPVTTPQPEVAPVVVTRPQTAPIPVQVVAAQPVPSSTTTVRIVRINDDAAQAEADTTLLAELAKSQEVGGATLRVAAAQGFAVPERPVMNEVPELLLPAMFCSPEQRNLFHETRYKPVMELARANNAAAVAHMQRLQQVYDQFQLARDPTPMNAIANEASAYQQQVATNAYNRQLAMVQQFDGIMAVPVGACQVATAK